MPKDIEGILAGEKPVEETTPADVPREEQTPETPPEVPAQAAAEPGKEQEAPEAAQPDTEPDPVRRAAGMQAAYTAEKKKRQEFEQRLEQLQKEAQERDQWYRQQSEQWQRQLQQFAPKPPESPKPNLFEDPDAWTQQAVQQPLQTVEQRLKFQFSERLARFAYKEEYGEAEKWAQAQVSQNPSHPLRVMLANSDDPGEVLVQEYRKHKLASEMADPAAYRQKLLEEMLSDPEQKKAILARLGAEPLKPAQPSQPTAPTNLPSNLAGARSVGGSKGPVWQGQKPLNEIIGGNSKR